jgi:hypothetical protein
LKLDSRKAGVSLARETWLAEVVCDSARGLRFILECGHKIVVISIAFKPFKLRYITIDCWSIEIKDLNEFVLTSGEVKIDVVLVVC